jgi:pyruvate/2-oxoglutarate dehydrogenase complex dihydrolipoamide acyltransferase (E2) component
MPIELKMPALSPTMEEGTLAKWLKQEGDTVSSGDLLAEIETDKATMEFEAVDEGIIAKILVPEGTDEVKVGTVIAILAQEGEDASAAGASASPAPAPAPPQQDAGETGAGQPATPAPTPTPEPEVRGYGANPAEDKAIAAAQPASQPQPAAPAQAAPAASGGGDRVKASPLARRLAEQQGIDLSGLTGSGPAGRIVKADIDAAAGKPKPAAGPAAARRRRTRARRNRTGPRCRPTGPRHSPDFHRHSARGGEALQHAQDDRAPPHRGQADDPAHLPHRRHPPRRAPQAPCRTQQGPGKPRREAQRQRHADQGARRRAH